MDEIEISSADVNRLYDRLQREAEVSGYHLNPDVALSKDLVRGLLVNESRYGYWACPCRLAAGVKDEDLDLICPCDYRDPDLDEYGSCYCALYVSSKILKGDEKVHPIPDRRPPEKERRTKARPQSISSVPMPVWRCRVCGYLCARDNPPEVCPICKAKKERFERFL